MSATDPGKKLAALLKRLAGEFGERGVPAPGSLLGLREGAEVLIEELIFSFLLCESSTEQAVDAHARVRSSFVDDNELRVALPDEIAEAAGQPDEWAAERSMRLRACLAELYRREQVVTLAPLAGAGKREIRMYLESLEGMPLFVAARMMVVCFGGHAVPVDSRLARMLAAEGVVTEGADLESVTSWLEHHVRAPELAPAVGLFQAWSDAAQARRSGRGGPRADGKAESKPRSRKGSPRASGS